MSHQPDPVVPYGSVPPDRGSMGYVYLVSMVAAVGGLLFGYDTAVISGAIEFVTDKFGLNEHQEGWAVSCLLVGCVIGASFAGVFSDRYGRKKVLIATAIIYAISAVWSALASGLATLVLARFLGGLAVGVSSLVAPIYIAEIAPRRIRGRLVSLQQMAIVTGILLAYIVNWRLVDIGPTNWRWMFASETVPAIILFIALFIVPESPRWLLKKGDDDRATDILARVGGRAYATEEKKDIQASLMAEEGSLRELFAPGLRIALIIGIVLAVFQQITGINTIMYYAPKIFERAGYAEASAATWATVLVGLTNCTFTLLALWIIDRVGRKLLLLIGSAGMAACLITASYLLPAEIPTPLKLIPILAYVAFFAIGLGATVWVILAEIFPTKVRGRAVSIGTVSLWIACFAVAQTFPYLIEHLGESCFWIYAVMAVIMFIFVAWIVPETKGQSLEEIARFWMGRTRAFPVSVEEPIGDAVLLSQENSPVDTDRAGP